MAGTAHFELKSVQCILNRQNLGGGRNNASHDKTEHDLHESYNPHFHNKQTGVLFPGKLWHNWIMQASQVCCDGSALD